MSLANETLGLTPDQEGEIAWPVLRAVVLVRDKFTCAMCGAFANQVDHIFARAHGGSDALLNLQAACKPCNQRKGNALPTERFQFFQHLNLEQCRHLAENEMGRVRENLNAQMSQLSELIDQRQAAS